MARSRSLSLMMCLILLRAREVLTTASQSLLGCVAGLRQHIDDVAVAQHVAQGNDAAVYFRAGAGVPDLGVNGVGEIDRARTGRKHDHAALGSEAVNLLGIEIHFERGHELAGIAHVLLPFDELPQPRHALIVLHAALAFLVFPVRRDAFLGDAVHLFGADLNFEVLAFGADHRSVQRLIKIRPRDRNEILDPAGHRRPFVVDHAQRAVAVLHRVGDDADGEQIVDLVERDLLPFELLIDGVGALHAGFHARRNALAAKFGFDRAAHALEVFFVGGALGFDRLRNFRPGFGIEIPEGQIFQFAADLAHAEAVRDGRIDLQRLARRCARGARGSDSPASACYAAGRPA